MANANHTFPDPVPHTPCGLSIRSTRRLKLPRCGFRPLLAVMLCSLGTAAHADLPLVVESLLTDKGKLKLNLSLAYNNNAVEGLLNSDAVIGTAALRYGLTGKTEIYARGTGQYSSSRSIAGSMTDIRFLNTWAGASYQFKKDTETPAVIGFLETALLEKGQRSTSSFQSWAAGITAYKSIDPIVFVFSAYYGVNLPRKDGNLRINPGNIFDLNPSVSFSVNDRVTLSAGVRWSNTWPWHSVAEIKAQNTEDEPSDEQSEVNETRRRQYRETNTDLQLGVDYGFSDNNILNVTFSSNVSGSKGSNLRLDWLHTF